VTNWVGRPRIMVDWDGTCVTNTWPEMSTEWMPGAVRALHKLSEFADVVIYTARIGRGPEGPFPEKSDAEIQTQINYIRQMLDEAGLPWIEIWNKPWKPGAMAYVDDKAVHYTGHKRAWDDLVDKLAAMAGKEELIA